MLLALCTTQVKKRFLKKEKKLGYEKLLQEDSNPDPQNQLELKVSASFHCTTLVNADNLSLKEVYIPSLW